ncbi:hypothetical protein HBH98_231250 [Parastagonospora nodorum]|nr:hypothetical protein HBH49_236950 [Parastagonospora nodorum]KAH4336262.1 hypothetical protein HBH98_231250 [Parastagonospora nodorum]KAH4357670.1 hypothetical protein HBH97_222440 [Parastagonospora nodorum]KAH4372342.1 hypothetical protein HBH99_232570 [Parastagonospora nodorum]KAH5046427.1 hypothetical protein HBH96_231100 [Parastagonospora nodorum]
MSPSCPLFPGPTLPSRAQAALAITILRTKPANITIRDYLLRLREHCRPGRPAESPEEYEYYLDLVGYWREQCQKAHDECDRLQGIIIRLERSNHQLSQRTNTFPEKLPSVTSTAVPAKASPATHTRPSTANNGAKRHAPVSLTRAPKRPRASATKAPEQSISQTQDGIESDFEFLEGLGNDGKVLLESLYTTHQLCRASAPDAETLCRQLVRTSTALAKIIRLIAHNHEHLSRQGRKTAGAQSLGDDRSGFSQALTISARAFMSVLVGVTKMMDESSDDRLPSLVVCELADTFKAGLVAIELSAQHTADVSSSAPVPTQKGKVKAPVPKESLPARSMAHFLVGIMGLLDKTNVVHQKLFDAFAFLLLERAGKRLYYCTFGRHRSATIEEDLAPLPEPSNPAAKAQNESQAMGIRLELKALVLILERAMGLAPHHMNPANGKAAKSQDSNRLCRTLSMKTLPAAPKGRLSPLAKDRLQRTLVACMYGTKQDDEFLDVLTKPMPAMRISTLSNVAKIDDKDVEQWYKEEVWRLVGWDIMAREGGW